MQLRSNSLLDGQPIPERFAFCVADPESHVRLGANRNPDVEWSDVPAGTRSLVLICHDPDVPSRADDVNRTGRLVPPDLPRIDFTHWVLVDIDPERGRIAEGELCSQVTAGGKSATAGPDGMRHGVNSYTDWFAADAGMAGDYYGYDGPCPPWNDSIVHHYHFRLYALDIPRCPVEGRFDRTRVLSAMEGHVLAEAVITGTYSLNPEAAAG